MRDLHEHYNRLSEQEKQFVDDVFCGVFSMARDREIRLIGDDRAERAVDAFARLVIESREPGTLVVPWQVAEYGREKDAETFRSATKGEAV